jgi:hypothetical protein
MHRRLTWREADIQAADVEFQWQFPEVVLPEMSRILPPQSSTILCCAASSSAQLRRPRMAGSEFISCVIGSCWRAAAGCVRGRGRAARIWCCSCLAEFRSMLSWAGRAKWATVTTFSCFVIFPFLFYFQLFIIT